MDSLDHIQTLAAIEAFDPASYATELASAVGPAATLGELEQRDAQLTRALVEIDDTMARVMRIRLEHAADAMAAQTRRVFASTIASYAGKLDLLEDRVRSTRVAEPVVQAILAAARATLELRDALRGSVLTLVQTLAAAAIPDADRQARDPQLDDAQRKKWSQVRRDLEVLAVDPERIRVAPMAARIAAWPEQLDEPAAKPEVTFADMIEID
jgi:hypothetical protein